MDKINCHFQIHFFYVVDGKRYSIYNNFMDEVYFNRNLESLVKISAEQFPAVLVTGPRQSGKSTLLKHVFPEFTYVSLDLPNIRSLALADPNLFLQQYKKPVIIDEIQYVPDLLHFIKHEIDKDRRACGRFILTGSQTFQVIQSVTESLAGRVALLSLLPFNWRELAQSPLYTQFPAITEDELAERIIRGFYPESLVNPALLSELWYSSYVGTYLERDVRNIRHINDLSRFQTFVGLLAARAGALLNLSEVARECGISQPTARDWLSVLESSYVVYLLKPYHSNKTKRLIKSPKLYFHDTGLLCFFLGIDTPDRFFKAAERGHVFENMLVMDAVKQASALPGRTAFSFYRTKSGVEVDLLVENKQNIIPVEIKLSKTINRSMAEHLSAFSREFPSAQHGFLASLQEEDLALYENVTAVHWTRLCGANGVLFG
jgi:predicted AAA+ superfamily ATPase